MLDIAYSAPPWSHTIATSRPYWKPEVAVPFWAADAGAKLTHTFLSGIACGWRRRRGQPLAGVEGGAERALRQQMQQSSSGGSAARRRTPDMETAPARVRTCVGHAAGVRACRRPTAVSCKKKL